MATGFKSAAKLFKPSRCASSGIVPPPTNGSKTAGRFSPTQFLISLSASSKTSSLLEFSHLTSFSIIANKRLRSASCNSGVGNFSGFSDGSSISDAKSTTRAVAKGRRAQYKCKVEGCPWRIDFSRADSLLIISSGSDTSINFFFSWNTSKIFKVILAILKISFKLISKLFQIIFWVFANFEII